MAIQLIINRELGVAKNEYPIQCSFLIEELIDLVEAAVMNELNRLSERVVYWERWNACTRATKYRKKVCITKH